jgi:hypothetical protein
MCFSETVLSNVTKIRFLVVELHGEAQADRHGEVNGRLYTTPSCKRAFH